MIKIFAFAAVTLLLSGCVTSTKFVDSWQAESFSRDDLNNVLIVAVTSNTTYRFIFEAEIERRILKGGRNGITSLRALGDKFPRKEAVLAYVAENDIDYVMVTSVANVETVTERVPESVRTYYTGPYYPSVGYYYGGMSDSITMVRESYVDTRTTVVLVTTIFDAKTEEPVWVGHSRTFEPGSIANLAGDIARASWNHISR